MDRMSVIRGCIEQEGACFLQKEEKSERGAVPQIGEIIV
jgi:hypothetical protein